MIALEERHIRSRVVTQLALFKSLLNASRLQQWGKQCFVLTAVPTAVILHGLWAVQVLIGLVGIFCAVASCAYFVNDVKDVHEDRNHPKKRFRPIAAGEISIRLAMSTAIFLALGAGGFALLLSAETGQWGIATIVLLYVIISQVYNAGLKNTPVLDMLLVGSLYSIRTLAGFVAISGYLATWYLWVVLAGILGCALVLVKRHSEARTVRGKTRKTLEFYKVPGRLDRYFLVTSSLIIAVFIPASFFLAHWFVVSSTLVVFALIRIWTLVKKTNEDEHPQDLIRKDWPLKIAITAFVIAFSVANFQYMGGTEPWLALAPWR